MNDMKRTYDDILRYLAKVAGSLGVSVFPESRPQVSLNKMDAFAVVGLSSALRERGAYRTAVARFTLYAEDRCSAMDVATLGRMVADLQRAAVPEWGISLNNPRVMPASPDGIGYHYVAVQYDLTAVPTVGGN